MCVPAGNQKPVAVAPVVKQQRQLEEEPELIPSDLTAELLAIAPELASGPATRAAANGNVRRGPHDRPKHAHLTVRHDYHDHSLDEVNEEAAAEWRAHSNRGGVLTPFPLKLQEMLSSVEVDGHEDVVSWQPHGRCFVVHDQDRFRALLPLYFPKLTKMASFQRQLNLYGFVVRSSLCSERPLGR
jgi:hypothetical protein